MLEKIRHYSLDTYRRLMRLSGDFEIKGELFTLLLGVDNNHHVPAFYLVSPL